MNCFDIFVAHIGSLSGGRIFCFLYIAPGTRVYLALYDVRQINRIPPVEQNCRKISTTAVILTSMVSYMTTQMLCILLTDELFVGETKF
jgi:hypothetical protein